MTYSNGTVVQTNGTDAFGLPAADLTRGSGNQSMQFTGEYTDKEDGFTYLRARYYDPQVGRDIQADSVRKGTGGVVGWNRYICVDNDPVLSIDPTGQSSFEKNTVKCGDPSNPVHLLCPERRLVTTWGASVNLDSLTRDLIAAVEALAKAGDAEAQANGGSGPSPQVVPKLLQGDDRFGLIHIVLRRCYSAGTVGASKFSSDVGALAPEATYS